MKTDPTLVALASRRPAVMLDTTYCSPAHVFPAAVRGLAAVRDAVKAESFNPRCCSSLGRTPSKEVFFEAAKLWARRCTSGNRR